MVSTHLQPASGERSTPLRVLPPFQPDVGCFFALPRIPSEPVEATEGD